MHFQPPQGCPDLKARHAGSSCILQLPQPPYLRLQGVGLGSRSGCRRVVRHTAGHAQGLESAIATAAAFLCSSLTSSCRVWVRVPHATMADVRRLRAHEQHMAPPQQLMPVSCLISAAAASCRV